MLGRIVLAIVIGIVVFLVCTFLGGIAATVAISWVAAIGAFFAAWAALIGLLACLWYYFAGGNLFNRA